MTKRDDQIAALQTRIVRVVRERTGLHEQFAVPIAEGVISEFFKEVAGERVYVTRKDRELRAKVVADFNGKNRAEICTKYKIGKTTFYRYLRNKKK